MFREKDLNLDITAIVFTIPERRLAEMDIAMGPCVPLKGSREALISPLSQAMGETPRQTAALYKVLTGKQHDDVLVEVARSGDGVLYSFSDEFVDAMVDANIRLRELGRQDESRNDENLTLFNAHASEYDKVWLAEGRWPKLVVSTRNRLTRLAQANEARKLSQPLYCWFGPSVAQLGIRVSRPLN